MTCWLDFQGYPECKIVESLKADLAKAVEEREACAVLALAIAVVAYVLVRIEPAIRDLIGVVKEMRGFLEGAQEAANDEH